MDTSSGHLVALTGATGFLGRSVVHELSASPTHHIRALTRRPKTTNGVDWIEGDLDTLPALTHLCQGADTLIHIAGLTKARTLKHLLDVNEKGTASLVQIAREAGIKRFILISSIAAREPHLSHYANSKHAGEEAARAQCGDMELLIIRPPAIIGPGDDAIKPMLDILKRGYLPAPAGRAGKEGKMAFVYVDDVARFIVSCISAKIDRQTLTPYGATPVTNWQSLAEDAAKALARPVKVVPIAPSLLKIAAFLAEIVNSMLFRSGFFNSGKVRELLHPDWTGDTEIGGSRSLQDAFELTFHLNSLEEN